MAKSSHLSRILLISLVSLFPTLPRAAAEVRVVDPLTDIRSVDDVKAAPGRATLRMVAPRNGRCSGVVVVFGADTAELRARIGPLTGEDGAALPPEGVRIRYATKEHVEVEDTPWRENAPRREELDSRFPYYDILHPGAPDEADILPVWITIDVPAAAAPGAYEGTLALAGEEVPVRVEVGAWGCPDPERWIHHAQFDLFCDRFIDACGVKPWSDEHWKLIGESFDVMKELGTSDLYLALWKGWRIDQAGWDLLGSLHPHIRFREEEGGFVPDMTVVDRYLELYAERIGQPHALIVCAFDPGVWSYGRRDARKHRWPCPSWRAVVVGEDGGQRLELLPLPGEPSGNRLWTQLMDGIRRKAVALGWKEEVIHIGQAHDARPPVNTVDFFKSAAPYARWSIWTHGRGDPAPEGDTYTLDGGMVVGHYTHPYAVGLDHINPRGIMGGWDIPFPVYTLPRKYLYQYSPLSQWRQFADGCTAGNRGAGFDHIRFNAWGKGPHCGPGWDNFYRLGPRWIVAPGPDGPLGTVRLEMLREGQQEAEARIALEKAVAGGKLSPELDKRCSDLLLARWQALRKHGEFNRSHAEHVHTETSRLWGLPDNWQDSALQLFNLAGEVKTTGQ